MNPMARPLLIRVQEVVMEAEIAKHTSVANVSRVHCVVCGARLASGELCGLCERRGLSPQQYAEFFWEEA